MTQLIDTVQLQEVGDGLVDLFDILINGEMLYLYGGLDGAGAQIEFADESGTLQTYVEFPIEVEGLDWSSDGAASRPTLRIANVLSLVTMMNNDETVLTEAAYLGIIKNEDLIGAKVTRRRTLEKYLGVPGTPVEFPKQIFILDRISSENNVTVEFELASPFDVEGVQLPSRVVVGKYCPWKYQGATDPTNPSGGCSWPQNSRGLYLDIDDQVITGTTAYSSGTTYVKDDKVTSFGKVWRCIRPSKGNLPEKHPSQWTRIDLCGKTVTSCKARFQNGSDNSVPLPFGGFPGSKKFK